MRSNALAEYKRLSKASALYEQRKGAEGQQPSGE